MDPFKFKVYIASPYTLGDMAANVRNSLAMAEVLIERGYTPFAPLLTHFWHLMFPHDDPNFWYEYDLEWVLSCDVVLRMAGNSRGADNEVAYAIAHGIPVVHSLEELDEGRWIGA